MIPRLPRCTLFPYTTLFRSGPGKCRIRRTNEEIDGSPLIALKFNFAKYFFVESDKKCCRALAARIKRSEEHTSELQSHSDLVCRLLLEKKNKKKNIN